jgi:hypothetical protein
VRDAVLAQQPHASVSSPLGIWALLCACLTDAEDPERDRLEEAVGCSRDEAEELLEAFLSNMPEAVKAALALWVRPERISEAFKQWAAKLPAGVEIGAIPTPAEANEWADRNTLGLIRTFPLEAAEMLVVLASAVATRVSWQESFEVGSVRERFSSSSPWLDAVEHVLLTERTSHAAIAETSEAGLVAVYDAIAQEDLTVMCVSAEPTVNRRDALRAAQHIAAHIATGEDLVGCSLFELPTGNGHSWTISERERPAWQPQQRFETIDEVALPGWEIESTLDLLQSDAFAIGLAIDTLERRLGSGPRSAQQGALGVFDRHGFKAAAVTAIGTRAIVASKPTHMGIERVAKLRFDHPFAALALTGHPGGSGGRFRGLPVFEAWIHAPKEVDSTDRKPE